MSAIEVGFSHYLVTRFNIRLREPASDEWLQHRLEYFWNTCVPSVRAQTAGEFVWLVLIDADSPNWFLELMRDSINGVNERLVLVEGADVAVAVAREIKGRSGAPDWLVTSRLDNDDAVSKDFIETVQSEFIRERFFLNFANGVQLTDSGEVYRRSDPSSPFISYFEPAAEARTVFAVGHHLARDHAPIRQGGTKVMWLQSIHGANIANQARGIRGSSKVLDRFAIERSVGTVGGARLLRAQIRDLAVLAARTLRRPHRLVWAWRVLLGQISSRPRPRA